VDLSLREGIHLQEVIHTAKEIDLKSKLCGFNQAVLGSNYFMRVRRMRNLTWMGWGLDIAELYTEKAKSEQHLQP
jgi:hypothetical protein